MLHKIKSSVHSLSLLTLAMMLIGANQSSALTWDDIDFPKIMYQSPSTYFIWYYNDDDPWVPYYPDPWVDASHYNALDQLGINVISPINTRYRYSADQRARAEMLSTYNSPGLGLLMNACQNFDTNSEDHLAHYRDAIGYEKWSREFYDRLEKVGPPDGPGFNWTYGGHNTFMGDGSELDDDQELFLTSGTTAGNNPGDFFIRPIFNDDRYGERIGHLLVQARTNTDVALHPIPEVPLLRITLWESRRYYPLDTDFDTAKMWIFDFDEVGYRLSPDEEIYDLSQYAEDFLQNDLTFRNWYLGSQDNTVEIQYNIRFFLGVKLDASGDSIDVFIDWLGIYDQKGWTAVASANENLSVTPDENYPTFAELEDGIEDDILYYYYNQELGDLILDWHRDDVSNHALQAFANLDYIVFEYTPNHVRRYLPCQLWVDSWPTDRIGDYLHNLSYREQEWLYIWYYPLRVGGNLQNHLSWYINNGIRFCQQEIGTQSDTKLITLIQCHADYYENGSEKTFRNPDNLAEILVQGYLALAYGSKGIGYYPYNPQYYDATHKKMNGIFKVQNDTWVSELCDDNEPKTDAIQQLNQHIDLADYFLTQLKWLRGECCDDEGAGYNPTTLQFVDFVYAEDPGTPAVDVCYVEICELEPQSESSLNDNDYFMIVNRSAKNSDPDYIEITIALTTQGESYYLHEIGGCSAPIFYNSEVEGYEFDLYKGCGKLFKIMDISQLLPCYEWNEDEISIKGEHVIPADKILNIAAGTTVKIFNDEDGKGGIVVTDSSGGLRINGASGNPVIFERDYHCKADEDSAKPWSGIHFKGTESNSIDLDSSYIEYATFENNNCGIKVEYADSGDVLTIENCTFTDCDTGVYTFDADLDISNSIFTKSTEETNTSFGIWAEESDVVLDTVGFSYCSKGIYFKGESSASRDTLTLTDCSISGYEVASGYGIKAVNADLTVAGHKESYTIQSTYTGINCDSSLVDLTNVVMSNMANSQGDSTIGIFATESNLTIDTLSISDVGDDTSDYCIKTYDSKMVMEDSKITANVYGLYSWIDGDTVEIYRSSFVGDGYRMGIRVDGNNNGLLKLNGRKTGESATVSDFVIGLYCSSTKMIVDGDDENDKLCILKDNTGFGAHIDDILSGSSIKNTDFNGNGDSESESVCGGMYLYNSSPDISLCYFESNTGPAIVADNGSNSKLGEKGDSEKGNQFDDNAQWSASTSAIIYEAHNSYTLMDSCYNNFYKSYGVSDEDTLTYFIKNTSQSSSADRKIRQNYWGGATPTASEFYPSSANAWDWTPICESANSIGGGSGRGLDVLTGGGGSGGKTGSGTPIGGFEALITLELQGDYEEAVEAYQDFIDSTDNIVELQVAMRRVLTACVGGNLELEPLLEYYDSFITDSTDEQVNETATHLKTRVKEYMGDYVLAILDYEAILGDNPSFEDSIYAVIDAGEAYLAMMRRGQSLQSFISPSQPTMSGLEPESFEAFDELRWELLTALWGGNSLGGDGIYGIAGLLPNCFALYQNYPNPFNAQTIIKYDLPEVSRVKIEVFNIMGQRVCILVDDLQPAGYRSVSWKGLDKSVSSGIYIYRINAESRESGGKFNKCHKLLLLK